MKWSSFLIRFHCIRAGGMGGAAPCVYQSEAEVHECPQSWRQHQQCATRESPNHHFPDITAPSGASPTPRPSITLDPPHYTLPNPRPSTYTPTPDTQHPTPNTQHPGTTQHPPPNHRARNNTANLRPFYARLPTFWQNYCQISNFHFLWVKVTSSRQGWTRHRQG